MGSGLSASQLEEYREVVKDRLSEDAIQFLYSKFIKAAPDGLMTPILFKQYIDRLGVYKYKKVEQNQMELMMRRAAGSAGGATGMWNAIKTQSADTTKSATTQDEVVAEPVNLDDPEEMYAHLFRGYDLDGDGVITFKEFLIYHLAVIYNTEELFFVVFAAYDADQDGFLSLADVKRVITAATRYVADLDIHDREVSRVIDEEARRLLAFLDIRKEGRAHFEDTRLICQRYPELLEKMKNLM